MEFLEINKNAVSEMNISLDGINNRLDTVGEKISESEDLANEFTHSEAQIFKNQVSLSELWDNIKQPNIKHKSDRGLKLFGKIMAEHFQI